ncbi:hypothetical protein PENSPDRAFT_671519 [Peniophora sp. CONT]|nr:hypothetical protein PENSPDRAFT_671519 [Peniophora sp. CONT]
MSSSVSMCSRIIIPVVVATHSDDRFPEMDYINFTVSIPASPSTSSAEVTHSRPLRCLECRRKKKGNCVRTAAGPCTCLSARTANGSPIRRQRGEKSVVIEIVTLLRDYMVPGERDPTTGRLNMGWIVLSQLPSPVREWLLEERRLWAQDVCAFPSVCAVQELLRRAHGGPLNVDFECLLRYCPEKDAAALVRCFFDTALYNGVPAITDASDVFGLDPFGAPRSIAADTFLSSWPSTFSGRTFTYLSELNLHIYYPLVGFTAPHLQYLTLSGVRAFESQFNTSPHPTNREFVDAWLHSPKVPVAELRVILDGTKNMKELVLSSLDLEADGTAKSITHRHLSSCTLRLRRPSSIVSVFPCVRGSRRNSHYVLVTRLAYGDGMPDWAWLMSGLDDKSPLALVVESSLTMVWLTFTSPEDAETSTRPLYCDGDDPYGVSVYEKDRPTLFVRRGRISRLYIFASDTYRRSLFADIEDQKKRIVSVHAVELSVHVDENVVWLRKNREWGEILRTTTFITRLVIEDERMGGLPLLVPKCCSEFEFLCREDWYGKPGLWLLAESVQSKFNQGHLIAEVRVAGCSRLEDAVAFSSLDSLSFPTLDNRSARPRMPPLSHHARRLELARAIAHYYAVRQLSQYL